jgi:hypothetical protein
LPACRIGERKPIANRQRAAIAGGVIGASCSCAGVRLVLWRVGIAAGVDDCLAPRVLFVLRGLLCG